MQYDDVDKMTGEAAPTYILNEGSFIQQTWQTVYDLSSTMQTGVRARLYMGNCNDV